MLLLTWAHGAACCCSKPQQAQPHASATFAHHFWHRLLGAGVCSLTFWALIVVVGTIIWRSVEIMGDAAYRWQDVQVRFGSRLALLRLKGPARPPTHPH